MSEEKAPAETAVQESAPRQEITPQRAETARVLIDSLELLRGEQLLAHFKGGDCACAGRSFFARADKIWLTNRRMVVKETTQFCGLSLLSNTQCFRYGNLHNVALQIDYRLRYLLPSIVSILGSIDLLGSDGFVRYIFAIILLLTGIVLILYFLSKLCGGEELKLDFYKEETVNTWIYLLDRLFIRRAGSSITVSLSLKKEDSASVIRHIYEHDLTPFAADKEE